jgi:GTP-binding protein
LEAFDPTLLERPFAIAATKIDAQGKSSHLQALQTYCVEHQYPCFPLSAITKEGLPSLVTYLGKAVLENKALCISKC